MEVSSQTSFHRLSFTGKVVKGDEIGRVIGFPTANLESDSMDVIPSGVFACKVTLEDGSTHPAMMNVGFRPTVSREKQKRIEVHLLDFSGNLYGQILKVEIIAYIRGEQKFDDLNALQAQLQKDRLAVQKQNNT